MKNKNSKKYLTRRTYRTNKKYFSTENSKGNENNRNSLISDILKNKKYLKKFANREKNNNIDNIRNNFENIFSTDETSLKTLKYIIKSRQEQKDLNSNYIKNNIGFFPKEKMIRISTSVKTIYRPSHSLDNKNKQNNRKRSNYTKRNILQISCDNILIDEEYSSSHNSKDIPRESKRKYNKRIIINNINNNDNDGDNNEKNKKYQIRKNKTYTSTYECNSKVNNNIKSYKFPFINSPNKNNKCNINITPSNDIIKEKEDNKKKEDENSNKEEFKDMQDNQIDKNNYLNISFSEDGPFIGQSEKLSLLILMKFLLEALEMKMIYIIVITILLISKKQQKVHLKILKLINYLLKLKKII